MNHELAFAIGAAVGVLVGARLWLPPLPRRKRPMTAKEVVEDRLEGKDDETCP